MMTIGQLDYALKEKTPIFFKGSNRKEKSGAYKLYTWTILCTFMGSK